MKGDGTFEIGGSDDNMVRYSKLAAAYNDDHNALNTLIGKWNAFVSTYVPGSPTVAGEPVTLAGSNVAASTGDISTAKITKIKTSGSDS
jgi:hypothetical protein